MRKIKLLLTIIATSFLFIGCPHSDDPDFYIKIYNNSDEAVYYHSRGTKDIEEYPDKYLYSWPPKESSLITINDFTRIGKDYNESTTTYRLFIYKASTLEANDWETVRDNGLYDARYDLTLEELEAMDFEIVYDGM